MITFWHSYKAEFLKNKHGVFLWTHIILPFLLVIFITFYRFRKLNDLALFDYFFKAIGFFFPIISAVLCGLIADQEKQAGHCQIMLSKLPHKATTFVSQLCMLLTMSLASIYLAIIIFIISMKCIIHVNNINYLLYFKTGFFIFLSVIFLYSLYLALAYHFSTGVCIVTGFAGLIIAALASTGQGDGVWMFLPWVWPMRIVNFILKFKFKVSGEVLSAYTYSELTTGLTFMTVMTICCIVIYILSFHFWEGRQK